MRDIPRNIRNTYKKGVSLKLCNFQFSRYNYKAGSRSDILLHGYLLLQKDDKIITFLLTIDFKCNILIASEK